MHENPKTLIGLLQHLKIQLFYITALVSLHLTHLAGYSPSFKEIPNILSNYFATYGNILVGMTSFIENLAGINTYFPGAVVILSAMGLTNGMPLNAIITFLFIYIPSILAHITNYYIGYFLKSKQDKPMKKNIWVLFFGTMWHPQLASTTSVRCGSKFMPFKRFLRYYLPSSFVYNLFWGITMYYAGSLGGIGGLFPYIFIIYIIFWTLLGVWEFYKK